PIARLLGWQKLGANLILDLARQFLVVLQEDPRVVLTLSDAIALVGVPRTGFLNDALGTGQLDDLAFTGNAQAVHDLELGLAEWRCDLVLHLLHARHVASDFLAILDRANATDVQAHRSVE